jgi:site-specific recombinase XerD
VTTLFRRGVGANVVQRLAGHHSLTVTQCYAHTTEADLREAVALLGGGFGAVTAATLAR